MNKSILYGLVGILVGIGISWVLFSTLEEPQPITVPKEDGAEHSMQMEPMGMSMDSMVNNLRNKSGDEFDKEFLKGMIEHHVGAVEMAKLTEQQASHQEIKNMAKEIITTQTSEIEKMKQWQSDWGY